MTSAADERSGKASVDDLPAARPPAFYRLENTVQPYDWGSTSAIQDLLGVEPDGRPAAELWMGAHPLAPSRVVPDGAAHPGEAPRPGGATASGTTLADLVRADPVGALGQRVLDQYGPRLPFLLKVLAAERALSLQVHPHPHRAREGFNRENRERVARDSPLRAFHDDQHKPEMVVAVSRFEGLSGFRRPARILELLDGLDGDLVARMRAALVARPTEAGVREAFTLALHARSEPDVAADLARTVASVRARAEGAPSRRPEARGARRGVPTPPCSRSPSSTRAIPVPSSPSCSTGSRSSRGSRCSCPPGTCTPTCPAVRSRSWRAPTTSCARG